MQGNVQSKTTEYGRRKRRKRNCSERRYIKVIFFTIIINTLSLTNSKYSVGMVHVTLTMFLTVKIKNNPGALLNRNLVPHHRAPLTGNPVKYRKILKISPSTYILTGGHLVGLYNT